MKASRRSFLAGAGTLLAAAAASSVPAAAGTARLTDTPEGFVANQPQSAVVSQNMWTQTTFNQFLNTLFTVVDSKNQKMTLKLRRIDDLRPKNAGAPVAFGLSFQRISGATMPQGTYQFSNGPLGKFMLFVVGSPRSAVSYYAVVLHR